MSAGASALRGAPLVVRRGPWALASWPLVDGAAALPGEGTAGGPGRPGASRAPRVAPATTVADAAWAALRAASDCGEIVFLLRDERELTGLLREELLDDPRASLPAPAATQRGWVLLTVDQDFTWEAVGVLAALSAPLAAAGVPIAAFSAFARDHLLVPAARLDEALAALRGICGEVRRLD